MFFFLRTGDDHFKGNQQVFLIDGLAALANGPEGCFIYQVSKIRAYGTGGSLGDLLQIHIFRQLDLPGVDLQGVQSALEVGTVHGDPAVETAGTEQCFVQNLGAVGGGQANDTLGGIEAVDLAQQLVQGLLLFGVVAVAVVPGAAHGVDLVDEDDAGGNLGGFLEEVTDAAGAQTHEHFHEVGTGDGEEGDIRLAGNGLGKQGLAGTGRTHQQRTLGQLGADLGVLAGIMQEIDDLLEGFLGLVLTCHIVKGHAGFLLHVDLGIALAYAAHHAVAADALGQHPHEQEHHGEHHDGGEDGEDEGIVLHDLLIDLHTLGIQLFCQHHGVTAVGQTGEAGGLLGLGLFGLFLGHVDDSVSMQLHLGEIAAFHGFQEVGIGGFLVLAVADGIEQTEENQNDGQRDDQRDPKLLGTLVIPLGGRFRIIMLVFHCVSP